LLLTLQASITRTDLKAGIRPNMLKVVEEKETDAKAEEMLYDTAVELLDKIFESL
jgi:hypothetical protein